MRESTVGVVTCASMHKQIEECLASLPGSFHIYPIIPSCTFSIKIDLMKYYLDMSTAQNDVTLLAYGICHPQILSVLAEYHGRVVRVEGNNCYEMFLGREKYGEYHRKRYWILNKPFFTKWKNEILTGFGAGTSNGRALIGDTYNKLAYVRFEQDELSIDLVEDFARGVGLEYEIHSADTTNLKRLLKEALATARSTRRVKVPKSYVSYPRESEMRTMIENIGEVIYKVDIHTKQFTFVSPQVERILGYTPAEFLDVMNDYLRAPFYHEDDRQQVVAGRYEFLVKCLNKGMQESYAVEYRVKHKNGDVLWVKESVYPSYSSDGTIESFVGKIADITEHKRADERLRASEQKLRLTFESIAEGVFVTDPHGNLTQVNETAAYLYGYDNKEAMIGRSAFELVTEKDRDKAMEQLKRMLEVGGIKNVEYTFVRKDGSEFDAELITTILSDASGDPVGVVGIISDIAKRREAEEELRIAEQNFRNSLDSSPLGIRIVTAEEELLYANQAILDIYGYSNIEELKGTPTEKRYTPKSYAEHQIRKDKRKQGKPVPADYEISIVRKDGEARHLQVFRKAVVWGGEIQFQALYQDITEHKRVEMALRQSEEFNSSLLTNSPSPILVLNADASIRYVNPALKKLTGFSSAELIGSKSPYPWWIEETHKELSRRLAQAMHLGTRKDEFLYKKKNGERFWVGKIFKTVKVNGELKYYLVNWVDLTEQKRLKGNMDFYLAEVTRAQEEERRRIAREIHDESIQSLAALALGIDAIAAGKERLPEDVIRRLKGLRTEANSISDGLRRFSHELRPGVIDQVGLVPALEILTEELNQMKKVKAVLEVAGSERRLPPETELALFRIAQEALRNVKKHSRATRAAMKLKFTGGRIKLTVSDNGRGFEPPDTLSDFATESKLGLIGIQERTRLLGGKFLVKSRVGRGTTVVVEVADIG